MPPKPKPKPKLPGPQRAAVLLMYLDRPAAQGLLSNLTAKELQEIGVSMGDIESIDPEIIESVVRDFIRDLHAISLVPTTGKEYALGVLPGLIDEQRRPRIYGALRRKLSDDFVEYIANRPPRTVATILMDEHPQTQAVALHLMGPDNAAKVLHFMDEQERFEVTYRMAQIEQVPGELADDVETSLWDSLEDRGHDRWKVEGIDQTASILGRLSRDVKDNLLERLSRQDEDLTDTLRKRMIVFEDLGSLDGKAVQLLLKNVERSSLLIALRGADQTMMDLFATNMSSRAATDLLEELELMSPLPKSEVMTAREEIVQMALSLQEEGVIRINSSMEEELL